MSKRMMKQVESWEHAYILFEGGRTVYALHEMDERLTPVSSFAHLCSTAQDNLYYHDNCKTTDPGTHEVPN